ncbi:hypothetical protein [Geosporobacter ferrireducens]|uniref:hypothetical protein n=1 Tax=Geosporobacter ferrireducens TaxID=1424294 RepID=UPI002356DA42|nr:hypothetical protein [Geosporobacter ferrireducens]
MAGKKAKDTIAKIKRNKVPDCQFSNEGIIFCCIKIIDKIVMDRVKMIRLKYILNIKLLRTMLYRSFSWQIPLNSIYTFLKSLDPIITKFNFL